MSPNKIIITITGFIVCLMFKYPIMVLVMLNDVPFLAQISISSLASYILYKTFQNVKSKVSYMNLHEFIFIFCVNFIIFSFMACIRSSIIDLMLFLSCSVPLSILGLNFSNLSEFGLNLNSPPKNNLGTEPAGSSQNHVAPVRPSNVLEVRSLDGKEIVFLPYAGNHGLWVFKDGHSGDHEIIYNHAARRYELRNLNAKFLSGANDNEYISRGLPVPPKNLPMVPNPNYMPKNLVDYNKQFGLISESTLGSESNQSSSSGGTSNNRSN